MLRFIHANDASWARYVELATESGRRGYSRQFRNEPLPAEAGTELADVVLTVHNPSGEVALLVAPAGYGNGYGRGDDYDRYYDEDRVETGRIDYTGNVPSVFNFLNRGGMHFRNADMLREWLRGDLAQAYGVVAGEGADDVPQVDRPVPTPAAAPAADDAAPVADAAPETVGDEAAPAADDAAAPAADAAPAAEAGVLDA